MNQLPLDLLSFLERGEKLHYNLDESVPGKITLVSADDVRLRLFSMNCEDTDISMDDPNLNGSGSYLVEAVDLIVEADGGYDSEGILVWLSRDQRYGAWDGSHNIIYVFDAETTWSDIIADPLHYLNAQWGGCAPIHVLKPWEHHIYHDEPVYLSYPFPARWFYAEQTLRGNTNGRIARMIRVELATGDTTPGYDDPLSLKQLKVKVSKMGHDLEWQTETESSRPLTADEQASLDKIIEEKFWQADEAKTKCPSPEIIWRLESLDLKRSRRRVEFYSTPDATDSTSELGHWLLKLAGQDPLSF